MIRKKKRQPSRSLKTQPKVLPFVEHLHELRRRLFIVAVSVIGFSVVGYLIQDYLIRILLLPAKNQQFIYTSPGGGINFIFQISIYFGVALSVPIIVSQILSFVEPIIKYSSKRFLIRSGLFSVVLAAAGTAFGYFIGLPAALHFLSRQFTTSQIEALLTIQEYMSFVTIYLVGSALLFQIPLIMVFTNRIKPLKPRGLLKMERYVIVLAFIAAAVITPTPDIFNQLLIAGPIIAIYQFGILLVWLQNKRPSPYRLAEMLEDDARVQAERLARLVTATEQKLERKTGQVARSYVPAQRRLYIDVRPRPITFERSSETPAQNT